MLFCVELLLLSASAPSLAAYDELREGRDLFTRKKWAEAALVLKRASRKHPGSATTTVALAKALTYAGRREEALAALVDGVARTEGVKKKRLVEALRVISRVFSTQESFQLYEDGITLLAAKKYRAAREKLDRALELDPYHVEVLTRLGQCLVLEGDFDSAAERLRLARKLNPYEPEVRLWLGRALSQRGERPEALRELRAAGPGLQGSETLPLWLGETLASVGQELEAIRILEDDARTYPLHVQSLVTAAQLRAGRIDASEQDLWSARKLLQLAQSRLGEYFPAEGQKAPPAREGELGLALRPSEDEAREQIQKQLRFIQAALEKPTSASRAE